MLIRWSDYSVEDGRWQNSDPVSGMNKGMAVFFEENQKSNV